MDILQILVTAGALSVLALVIGLLIMSRIKAPTSEAITKDVLDQIVKNYKVLPQDATIDLGQLPYSASKPIDEELVIKATGTDEFYVPIETSTKSKKKRKYYPKKPKTQL